MSHTNTPTHGLISSNYEVDLMPNIIPVYVSSSDVAPAVCDVVYDQRATRLGTSSMLHDVRIYVLGFG